MRFEFGFEEEWKAFADSHKSFMERVDRLFALGNKVFIRTQANASPVDQVVYSLGRLIMEDFSEILLLCANGYGFAALRLLRSMYEKCVTASYLSGNPAQAQDFLDYHYVQQWKLARRLSEDSEGGDAFRPEETARMKADYERVKSKFMQVVCDNCGTERPRPSWSKLDLYSMARKVGNGLDAMYGGLYLLPTLQAHATRSAVLARVERSAEGGFTFMGGAQREPADHALIGAHNLLLNALDLQIRHFNLNLEQEKAEVFKDFMTIWGQGAA